MKQYPADFRDRLLHALDAGLARAEAARTFGVTERTIRRVRSNTAKAWRFEGEMYEIADTFRGAGLPGEFHQAAAQIFKRLARFKDQDEPPAIEAVLETLLNSD